MELKEEIIIINGQRYLTSDARLIKCAASGKLILRSTAIPIATVVALDRGDGLRDIGKYSYVDAETYHSEYHRKCFNLISRKGEFILAPSYSIIGNGLLHPADPEIYGPNTLLDEYQHARLNNKKKFRAFNNMVRSFKQYDNEFISEDDKKVLLERDYEFGVRTLTNKIFEGIGYTYGVELETSSGRLSEKEAAGLNLKCEFDGSLRETPDQRKEDVLGGEYITGVLTGDAGMFQLQNICNALSKNCTINDKCGVHVHIGGLTFTKENIVYMYILGMKLQHEFFELLPTSRKKNTYCRLIKELAITSKALNDAKTPLVYGLLIDEYFNKIFIEVSHGKSPDKNNNKLRNHPMGSKCGYNKDTQRYCWLNFVTAMFNTKDNIEAMTLEFRSHSATLSYNKVKNWVKICMAFVNFAENHQSSIKRGFWLDKCGNEYSINLNTIVMAAYPKTNNVLIEYMNERKYKFLADTGSAERDEYVIDKENINNLNKIECVS